MAAQVITILNLIEAAWNADLGNGVDLSGTGTVTAGRFPTPPRIPFLAYDLLTVEGDNDGPPLGKYLRTATVFVEGWHAVTASTIGAVLVLGTTAADEVMDAAESALRDTAGTLKAEGVRTLNWPSVEFLNTEINGRKIAHWRGEMQFTYITSRGI